MFLCLFLCGGLELRLANWGQTVKNMVFAKYVSTQLCRCFERRGGTWYA